MANTTNYNWETPDDTDLVKDGAAAIRTLGSSIDTTTKNLNPETTTGDIAYRSATANTNTRLGIGTTGQVLTVAAGVPSWATPATGDIEGVTAGTGISGGGTSGTVTVTNSMATAIDAKGDLIAGTGADTFARLAVGTNGHTLVADSAEATGLKWAAPAAGGKVLQVIQTVKTDTFSMTGTTYTDVTGISQSITPSSASSKILVIIQLTASSSTDYGAGVRLVRGSTAIYVGDSADNRYPVSAPVNGISTNGNYNVGTTTISYLDSPATTSSTTYKIQARSGSASYSFYLNRSSNDANDPTVPRGASSITLMEIGA
jgi:hypothetical protein